jgi:hypothetical protein
MASAFEQDGLHHIDTIREAMEGIDATHLVYPDITRVSGCL